MFGKPEWFKQKRIGFSLTPICWQGWLYTATWLAVVLVPFLALFLNSLGIESLIWMTATLGAATLDVKAVLKAMKKMHADEDVLYIDDSETVSEELATRHYDFRLRR